jgi:hypothetical protein
MRRLKLRVSLIPILLVVMAIGPISPPACDSKRALDEAAEAAKDIGGGVRDVTAAVGQAYDKQLITLAQKDRLADILIRISQGGQQGVETIAALHAAGVTDIDGQHRIELDAIFTNAVVGPFLELLTEIGRLPTDANLAIRASLPAVRSAILLFSRKISRGDVERQIHAAEEVLYARR